MKLLLALTVLMFCVSADRLLFEIKDITINPIEAEPIPTPPVQITQVHSSLPEKKVTPEEEFQPTHRQVEDEPISQVIVEIPVEVPVTSDIKPFEKKEQAERKEHHHKSHDQRRKEETHRRPESDHGQHKKHHGPPQGHPHQRPSHKSENKPIEESNPTKPTYLGESPSDLLNAGQSPNPQVDSFETGMNEDAFDMNMAFDSEFAFVLFPILAFGIIVAMFIRRCIQIKRRTVLNRQRVNQQQYIPQVLAYPQQPQYVQYQMAPQQHYQHHNMRPQMNQAPSYEVYRTNANAYGYA